MALLNSDRHPNASMQRWFGLSLALLLGVFAFLATRWSTAALNPFSVAFGATAILVCVSYYAIPSCQLHIIRLWQLITFPLAWTIGHLLMATVYYCVLLPIGLYLRTRGYDPLDLRDDAHSGWVERKQRNETSESFKQF